MEFVFRSDVEHRERVALFPGAYNPPTVAHVAIAEQALNWADEVVWVMPRSFPHKRYDGATIDERIGMLREMITPRMSIAISQGGLYAEIAEEAEAFYGKTAVIRLLCGRDAAERIEKWDYGRPGVFEAMVKRHPLIVASRSGHYAGAAIHLPMAPGFEEVSSSEVRRRIAEGLGWEHLVPHEIIEMVRRIYRVD